MSMREKMPPSDAARVHHMANLEGTGGPTSAWSGWVTFASMLLILLGSLHGVQGFLALFDEGYFVARSEELVLVSYGAWGAVMLLWGSILLVVGAALNARLGWARWVAAAIVMVDVVLQVGFLPSSPLLSAMLIGIDIVVLFALTARWEEAQHSGLM
jgi:hypothetical protein